MSTKGFDSAYQYYPLEWDTEYFGIKSSKAIINKSLSREEWDSLKSKFPESQFVIVENRNSDASNAKLIGEETQGYLVDVNIQFSKKLLQHHYEIPAGIRFAEAMDYNEQILGLTNFVFSKFTEDSELAKRNGDKVYYHWVLNSFGKSGKYFIVDEDEFGNINGFALFGYKDDACVIELISVSSQTNSTGIGTRIFRAVEKIAFDNGYRYINVGTQVKNLAAMNFYHKVGCKQIGCHQTYHLWLSNKK